jgi:predicted transcriptional regulator
MQYEFHLTPVHKRPISLDAYAIYCTMVPNERVEDIGERLGWTLARVCVAIQELALAGLVVAVYTWHSERTRFRKTRAARKRH